VSLTEGLIQSGSRGWSRAVARSLLVGRKGEEHLDQADTLYKRPLWPEPPTFLPSSLPLPLPLQNTTPKPAPLLWRGIRASPRCCCSWSHPPLLAAGGDKCGNLPVALQPLSSCRAIPGVASLTPREPFPDHPGLIPGCLGACEDTDGLWEGTPETWNQDR
jgi:hypothetical protein